MQRQNLKKIIFFNQTIKIESPVLTTSTDIILGTRKCAPCQEQVFIYFKLQEAIKSVIPLVALGSQ